MLGRRRGLFYYLLLRNNVILCLTQRPRDPQLRSHESTLLRFVIELLKHQSGITP